MGVKIFIFEINEFYINWDIYGNEMIEIIDYCFSENVLIVKLC